MQMLLLSEPESTKDRTDFGSDCEVKISGSSLVGTILAGRYKILEPIEVGSFKAHDSLLDQTVTIREAFLTSQRDGGIWRQKVHRLASVRNPNFLNVLHVVSEKSSDFVISEHPRGKSIAELLKERSRFDLEDVLALMTPLAGALDLAASFACCRNISSARWLFTESRHSFAANSEQRSLTELPPFFVKLDVWELVRPKANISPSFLTSKALKWGSKRVAVRQAALLTYELLGGKNQKATGVERWFKPVNELGEAGNSILYRGLQGSPLFKTSESFFHELESAIRSGARESREGRLPTLRTHERSMAYLGTNDVLRRFNRDTAWLVVGLLGVVSFAALAFALLIPEPRLTAADLQGRAIQVKSTPSLTAAAAEPFKIVDLNAKRSPSQVTSGTLTHVDQAPTESASKESHAPVEVAEKATPVPVLAFPSPGIATVNQKESERAVRSKAPFRSGKSPGGLGDVEVKKRLLELWHQSLVRTEKPRSWETFSKLDRRKKAAFTARKQP